MRKGPLIDRLDMDVGAVEHGKSTLLPLKGEEQVRAAKQNNFGALVSAEAIPGGEEYVALRVVDAAGNRHIAIVLLHRLEFISLGHHDRGR